jgi:hypothetical protein
LLLDCVGEFVPGSSNEICFQQSGRFCSSAALKLCQAADNRELRPPCSGLSERPRKLKIHRFHMHRDLSCHRSCEAAAKIRAKNQEMDFGMVISPNQSDFP